MRKLFIRLTAAAVLMPLGTLAPAIIAFGPAGALAQSAAPAAEPDLVQIQLTEAMVQQYIAAQSDIGDILKDAPQTSGDTPDPKFLAKLEAAAKKHKFASYDEFETVGGNIDLTLSGIDMKTKKYVGAEAVLKQEIADVQADSKMTPKDKKAALDELNAEIKTITPLKFKSNIDLVLKYLDKLPDAEGQKT